MTVARMGGGVEIKSLRVSPGVDAGGTVPAKRGGMKRFPHIAFLSLALGLILPACTATKISTAAGAKVQEDGDTFTGVVVASSPERITIKLDGTPKLLVLEDEALPRQMREMAKQ